MLIPPQRKNGLPRRPLNLYFRLFAQLWSSVFNAIFARCKPPNSFAASIGRPMGLTARAKPRRIRPFLTDVVNRMITARRPRTLLAIFQRNTVRENSAAQSQTSREITSVIGMIRILRTVFMGQPPFLCSTGII